MRSAFVISCEAGTLCCSMVIPSCLLQRLRVSPSQRWYDSSVEEFMTV